MGCPPRKILGPFMKWTRQEFKLMDQKERKPMTMHKALYPRGDVDRLKTKEEEDLPALKMHRYIDSKTT